MQQALNPAAGLLQSHNLIFNDLHRRYTFSGLTTTIAGRRLLSRARLIVHSERRPNYPSRPSLQLLSAKIFSSLLPRVPKSNPEIRRNLLETMWLRNPKNHPWPLDEFFKNPLHPKPLRSAATPTSGTTVEIFAALLWVITAQRSHSASFFSIPTGT